MKRATLIFLFLLLQSSTSFAVGVTADPELTGAAPLPSVLTPQNGNVTDASGFDNTSPPPLFPSNSRMFGAQLFTGTSADSGASIGFNPNYVIGLGDTVQVRLWGHLPSTAR